MRNAFFAWLTLTAAMLIAAGHAAAQPPAAAPTPAPGPERVLLVINTASPLSQRIGEMYARLRRVPPANLCRIQAPATERISRAGYNTILQPAIERCLRNGRLTEQIFYIVLTQGVPLHIRTVQGTAMQSDGASVDSELTLLYRRMRGETLPLAGPLDNPFYRQRDTPFDHRFFPIYLVTRLAAYSYQTVERMVTQSLAARDQGKVVIDLRANDDQDGNNWLRTTAVLLPPARVVLDTTPVVITNVKDAIGYASWGSNDRNRRNRLLNFRWLPGALMNEFVSTNGRTFERPPAAWNLGSWQSPGTWFQGSPQSLTADYLEEGATGASGHTDEPYLAMCPRPDVLFPAYLHGRNLAESYWMAIPGLSWMNIVVGDPLCRLAKGK